MHRARRWRRYAIVNTEASDLGVIPLDGFGPCPGEQRQVGDQTGGFQPLKRPRVKFLIQFITQRMLTQAERSQQVRGRIHDASR